MKTTSLLLLVVVACATTSNGRTMTRTDDAQLAAAIRNGDEAAAARLIAAQPALKRAANTDGVPYTLVAIFAGHRAIAEQLAQDRDDLDIFEAAALDRADRVHALLERDPGLARQLGRDGFTALHYAAHLGYVDVARALLDSGADPGVVAKNDIAATPLHSAVAGGQIATTRLLLEHGAPINATYEEGRTALHVAASEGNVPLVELLLAHGADRNIATRDGQRAIDLARTAGHNVVVRILETSTVSSRRHRDKTS